MEISKEAAQTALDACRTLMAEVRRDAFEATPAAGRPGRRAKALHSEADRYRDAVRALAAAAAEAA